MLLPHGECWLHEREVGVVGNHSLGEGRELNILFAQLADLLVDLLDGTLPAIQHGADLHGSGFDDGAHCVLLSRAETSLMAPAMSDATRSTPLRRCGSVRREH